MIAGRKRLATIVLALGVLALPASSPASAPGWGAPVNISPPGRDASSPQVALNAAGTAVAVWRLRVGRSTEVVQAAVREAGGTWGAPRDISMPSEVDPNGSQPSLHVALDPGGDAVAIWSEYAGGLNSVVTAVLPAAGDWGPPQQISTPGQTAHGPRVALNSTGNAVAVWAEYASPFWWETRVVAAARPAGGTWSAPQSIAPDGEPGRGPQVAVDRVGTAFAVWNAGRNCDRGVCQYAVQASVRPAGGTWSAPQDLSSDSYWEITAPQLLVDEAGNALVVWSRTAWYPSAVIESVDRPAGGQWSSPEVLAPTGTGTAPRLAVDSAGNAVAVWSTGTSSLRDVVASTRPAGGTWEAPRVLSTSMWENSRPDVAVDASGTTVVIWERFNIVWIAEHPAGGLGAGRRMFRRSAATPTSRESRSGLRAAVCSCGTSSTDRTRSSGRSSGRGRRRASSRRWSARLSLAREPRLRRAIAERGRSRGPRARHGRGKCSRKVRRPA